MTHSHTIQDDGLRFLINPTTREIVNVGTAAPKLLQYDHNSECLTFCVPRFVEGHDMCLCDRAEIHYVNLARNGSDRHADVYVVADLRTDPEADDSVIFTWPISGNATQYAGTLCFLIRFACLDGDTVVYAWHTEIFRGVAVADGMNNGEAVALAYSDVLEAWRAEVTAGLDTRTREAENAAHKAEAAADRADEAARQAQESAQTAARSAPVATVTQTDGGATISVTDQNGTTEATVTNGRNGTDGRDGNSAYIRFSAYSDGTNFTETWTEGQRYVGFATADAAPTDKRAYTWCLFLLDTRAESTFEIDGTAYSYRIGMTWGEWCASAYNDGRFRVFETYIAVYFDPSTEEYPSAVVWYSHREQSGNEGSCCPDHVIDPDAYSYWIGSY